MKVFNAVCFCVLMDHHNRGVEEAHPGYVFEKLEVFEKCSESYAFGMLDVQNQQRVIRWCTQWGVDLPIIS